jgi:hypothetical protein
VTSRSPGDIVVRPASERDGPALGAFRCSTGHAFEQEVEDFVRQKALRLALWPEADYRLLLVLDDERIAGCAAHHRDALLLVDRTIVATRLSLLALARADQGRRLEDGRRLSDLVMSTLIVDALKTRESDVLTAIVARDNLRSIRLCERNGLRSQIRYDVDHVRLWGVFGARLPSRAH